MEKPIFDPFYVAKVMEELLSKQYGQKIIIALVPKDATTPKPDGKGE